jgi:hypothetical protein
MVVEYRKSPRHRTLKAGKILYNRGLFAVECKVRNMSDGGACLEAQTLALPDTFELSIPIDNFTRPCRVAWKTPTRVGVAFLEQNRAA